MSAPDAAAKGQHGTWLYPVILLALTAAVDMLDMMVIAVLAPELKRRFHLTDSEVGLLAGCARISGAIATVPLARVADTWLRKRLLVLSLAVWGGLTILCGAAGSFLQVLIARMGVGAAEAASQPTSQALIADLTVPAKRAGAFAIMTLGSTLGNGLALAMGGRLVDLMGWRLTFIAVGIPGLLLAVIIALTFREPPRSEAAIPAKAPLEATWSALRNLVGRRSYIHLLIGSSFISLSMGIAVWIPSAFVRIFHLPLGRVGELYGSAYALASIVGVILSGYLGNYCISRDVRWSAWLPMIALLFFAPLITAMLFAPSFGLALVPSVLFAVMISVANAPLLTAIQAVARPSERATAIALVLVLAGIIGAGVGPIVIGVMSDLFARLGGAASLRTALIASATFPVWGALHLALASRSLPEDSAFGAGTALPEQAQTLFVESSTP